MILSKPCALCDDLEISFFDFSPVYSCFTFCRFVLSMLSVSSELKVIQQFALGARPFRDIWRKSSSEDRNALGEDIIGYIYIT